jgi:large subunit ribosomal protein L29
MKTKEIRTLPDDEISSEIEKRRSQIFKMKFQATGENVEKGSLKMLRRQIARLRTVLRERQISRVSAAGAAKEGKA